MKHTAVFLSVLLAAASVRAADDPFVLSPVYPSTLTERQSYLRLFNPGPAAGKVTVVAKDDQGRTLGSWTKVVAANTAPQVGMAEIEGSLTTAPGASTMRLEITSTFYGYVQHAVWNPKGGALTNLSNCGPRVISDIHTLSNVHSTLLKGTYPSIIVIANRGPAAATATIDVYDSGTGAKLGTYTSPSIGAGGHVSIAEETIEQGIGLRPSATQFHLTLKLTGTFQGSLAHLVDNFGAGVITDMTQRCAMFGAPPASYAEVNVTSKLSYIGDWTPVTKIGNVSMVEYYDPVPLGDSQRAGLIGAGWLANFQPNGSHDTKDPSFFTQTSAVLLEQGADGLLSIATDKYLPSAVTNGEAWSIAADFNGDGKADLLLPAHNESPAIDKASTAFISKPDGTFTKITLSDATQAHGATLSMIGGKPYVFTSGYSQAGRDSAGALFGSQSHYTFDKTANSFLVTHVNGSINGSGVVAGDFLGDGNTQVMFADASSAAGLYAYPDSKYWNLLYKLINNDLAAFRVCCIGNTQVNGVFTGIAGVYQLPKGYFNDKPQYDSYSSIYDPLSKTHNADVYSYDINNDGKPDALVHAEIFQGKPFPGSDFPGNWPLGKLQVDLNRGNGVFTDETDTLNPDYSETAGTDEHPTFIPDDNGGLLAIITKGWGVISTAKNYVAGTSGNRIFLNDGTGRFHLVVQDETMNVSNQVYRYLATQVSGCFSLSQTSQPPARVKLVPYRLPSGNINFMGSFYYKTDAACAQGTASQLQKFGLVNVPLDLNLAVDFRKDITITNRNGSKRIRTFGGDDVINKVAGDPDATIDGGPGRDRVVYAGNRSAYTITKGADGYIRIKENAAGGTTDTLINIEVAQFADGTVDLY